MSRKLLTKIEKGLLEKKPDVPEYDDDYKPAYVRTRPKDFAKKQRQRQKMAAGLDKYVEDEKDSDNEDEQASEEEQELVQSPSAQQKQQTIKSPQPQQSSKAARRNKKKEAPILDFDENGNEKPRRKPVQQQSDEEEEEENEEENLKILMEKETERKRKEEEKKEKERKKKEKKLRQKILDEQEMKMNAKKSAKQSKDRDEDESENEDDLPRRTKNDADMKFLLEEVKRIKSEKAAADALKDPAETKREAFAQVMSVDPKLLNPDLELRKLFGAKALKADPEDAAANGNVAARQAMQIAAARMNGSNAVRLLKNTQIVKPKGSWPLSPCEDLNMEPTDSSSTLFRFTRGRHYNYLLQELAMAVHSYDPNAVAAVVQRHPYFPEACLQMGEILAQYGDWANACEMVERCLYGLENSFPSGFDPLKARGRLDFRFLDENRVLFEALSTYSRMMSRRGCHRVALEISKILYSLDPEHDPMHSLLSIDFHALRARHYTFLPFFIESVLKDSGLDLLPNIMYSRALSAFLCSDKDRKQFGISYVDENPDALLKRAMATHPCVVHRLVTKCRLELSKKESIKPSSASSSSASAIPSQSWNDIFKACDLIASPVCTASPLLDKLCEIYVERSSDLWKVPEVAKWFHNTAYQFAQLSPVDREPSLPMRDVPASFAAYKAATPASVMGNIAELPAEILQGNGGGAADDHNDDDEEEEEEYYEEEDQDEEEEEGQGQGEEGPMDEEAEMAFALEQIHMQERDAAAGGGFMNPLRRMVESILPVGWRRNGGGASAIEQLRNGSSSSSSSSSLAPVIEFVGESQPQVAAAAQAQEEEEEHIEEIDADKQ